ncbi:hypothetical protein LTR70_005727 [Exophiala xenobiotica]|uniref:Heterokaryon incompatibility domain-containing protein n=1 Tax=Lithohypha guttulata TaxID=1690604 RepID=A0ABR0KDH0_9EURO|nr:hypothetical protein LTR24_004110 [Lithohypha guttulata]KAK5317722.1 hypothetical protein LTR70_005727 [Exophiala xenobiotica]
MRSVYKSAEQTLIWLGEDDGTVSIAEELATAIVRKIMRFDQPRREEQNAQAVKSVRQEISDHLRDMNSPGNLVSHLADLPTLGSRHWNALARFLSRPWFRRVWVIQEVAVSHRATVYCGDHEMDWNVVKFAAAWIARNGILAQTGEDGFRWADNVTLMFRFANPTAMTKINPNPSPLLWLIRDFEASDARDKVFDSLPLMFNDDVGRALPKDLVPDYRKSPESVYRDVARYIIQADRNLKNLTSLPVLRAFALWVPRWEYGFSLGNSGPLGLFPDAPEGVRPLYRASGRLPLQEVTLRRPKQPDTLRVRGLRLDRVTSISESIWANFVDIDFPPHPTRGSLVHSDKNPLWQTWNAYQHELLSYPSGEDHMTVLRLLLVANRTRIKQRADEDHMSEADFVAYLRVIGWNMDSLPAAYKKRQIELGAEGDAHRYSRDLVHSCTSRSVFGTSLGYLRLCNVDVHVGDYVCMLFGGKVLYTLRPREKTLHSGQTWRFLGEAYLHGHMDGSALSMKRACTEPAEIFDLH